MHQHAFPEQAVRHTMGKGIPAAEATEEVGMVVEGISTGTGGRISAKTVRHRDAYNREHMRPDKR